MKRRFKRSLLAGIGILFCTLPVTATLVNDKSPFTDETDGGATDQVNVI